MLLVSPKFPGSATASGTPVSETWCLDSLDLSYNYIYGLQLRSLINDLRAIAEERERPAMSLLDFSGNLVRVGEKEELIESVRGVVRQINMMELKHTDVPDEHIML